MNRKARRSNKNRIPAKRFFKTSLFTVGALLATQTVIAPRSSATEPTIFTVTNCENTGLGSLRQALGKRWKKTYSVPTSTISGNDDNSIPLSYDPTVEQVYLTIGGQPYNVTATDGTSVTLDGAPPQTGVFDVSIQPKGESKILFAPNLICPTGITITEELPPILYPIEIVGPGADKLTIDFSNLLPSEYYGFEFQEASVIVKIEGLTLKGLGIQARSDLEIDKVHFQNIGNPSWTFVIINQRDDRDDSTIVTNSTFSNLGLDENYLAFLIATEGSLDIDNSTFVGNIFQEGGLVSENSSVTISNSTFIDNITGGLAFYGDTNLSLFGNFFADNDLTGSICGSPIALNSFNLFDEDYSGCDSNTGTNQVIGSLGSNLGGLAMNGGTTPTVALLSGNPAIDYYTDGVEERSRDQRGFSRPFGAGYDVGAFEFQGVTAPPAESSSATCVSKTLGSVGFKFNSATLTNTTKENLDLFSDSIAKSGCKIATLNGHTAATGITTKAKTKYRQQLANQRALAVEDYLKSSLKKFNSTVTIKINAQGSLSPLGTNKNESGRKKNRRVEIIIN